jgi:UDP-3-O-[3-hydroxymyristoyl] glucosamine N-acyltransferase
MIAHNCRIGAHSALAACVAIAGSSVVGKRCILGGKVGLTGHITLCDDVVVLGTSFISHNITKPGVYSSALPSEEAGVWRRIVARIKRLDAMARRQRALEKHVGFSATDQDSSEE